MEAPFVATALPAKSTGGNGKPTQSGEQSSFAPVLSEALTQKSDETAQVKTTPVNSINVRKTAQATTEKPSEQATNSSSLEDMDDEIGIIEIITSHINNSNPLPVVNTNSTREPVLLHSQRADSAKVAVGAKMRTDIDFQKGLPEDKLQDGTNQHKNSLQLTEASGINVARNTHGSPIVTNLNHAFSAIPTELNGQSLPAEKTSPFVYSQQIAVDLKNTGQPTNTANQSANNSQPVIVNRPGVDDKQSTVTFKPAVNTNSLKPLTSDNSSPPALVPSGNGTPTSFPEVQILQYQNRSSQYPSVPYYNAKIADSQGDTSQKGSLYLTTEKILAKLTEFQEEQPPAATTNKRTTPLRQDINSQYMEAKTQKSEHALNLQSQEQKQFLKDDTGSQSSQNSGNTPQNNKSESVFVPPTTVSQTSDPTEAKASLAKPLASAPPTVVNDNDIIQQVLQKFRINTIQQNSKIVIKLHPAELGELKVDIQMKEGAVNANIVAQSRAVYEILEKNMPKLKVLMEQNGLVVDEIRVTLKEDVVGEYNLFHDDQSKDNRSGTRKRHTAPSSSFELQPDEEDEQQDHAETAGAVNVTA